MICSALRFIMIEQVGLLGAGIYFSSTYSHTDQSMNKVYYIWSAYLSFRQNIFSASISLHDVFENVTANAVYHHGIYHFFFGYDLEYPFGNSFLNAPVAQHIVFDAEFFCYVRVLQYGFKPRGYCIVEYYPAFRKSLYRPYQYFFVILQHSEQAYVDSPVSVQRQAFG